MSNTTEAISELNRRMASLSHRLDTQMNAINHGTARRGKLWRALGRLEGRVDWLEEPTVADSAEDAAIKNET